jgi:hypothetical protein
MFEWWLLQTDVISSVSRLRLDSVGLLVNERYKYDIRGTDIVLRIT